MTLDADVKAMILMWSESVPLQYPSPVLDLVPVGYLIATVTELSATLHLTTVEWCPSQ